MPIEHGTDPNNDLVDRDLFSRGPRGHPHHLPIQIRFLVRPTGVIRVEPQVFDVLTHLVRQHERPVTKANRPTHIHRRTTAPDGLSCRIIHPGSVGPPRLPQRQHCSVKQRYVLTPETPLRTGPRRQIHNSRSDGTPPTTDDSDPKQLTAPTSARR